jgi:serine/threonine protein kinase
LADTAPNYIPKLVLVAKGSFIYAQTQPYAVKITSDNNACNQKELEALQRVWNPFVIKIYDFFIEANCHFLFLEYCPGGSLLSIRHRSDFTTSYFLQLGRQLLIGLEAFHSRGIAHLDIKPSNILLDEYGGAKLADFGLSQLPCGAHLNKAGGTRNFMAPEILNHNTFDLFPADIYSLGVTFHILATGAEPSVAFFQPKPNVPPKFIQMVAAMLRTDPLLKPTAKELLENSVFEAVNSPKKISAGISYNSSMENLPKISLRQTAVRLIGLFQCFVLHCPPIVQSFNYNTTVVKRSTFLKEMNDFQNGGIDYNPEIWK